MSLRYTLGTGKGKKKKKKPNSVLKRIDLLLGRDSKNGNGKDADGLPPPQSLFRPRKVSTTPASSPSASPLSPKVSPRYLELAPKDRELLEKAIALLERSFWGDPKAPEETISEPQTEQPEQAATAEEDEQEDAPILRIDPVEVDPST